ncbi:sigma-54-dependent Fis family transcriptional regulator [Wenzhouxiangella sp. XN24]|nr:sigma-54-dependent Fis family transcriptional regulator [Wenzhouxiangella sp. XN24]
MPARILVVEDDAGLRELLRNELEDAGYRLDTAADCAAARKLIASGRPDLVVSDLRLPGDSGRELLEHCRSMEAPPGFIMITAFGTVEQAVAALKAGADDFLTKPLRLDHLRLAVARVLEARALRLQLSRFRSLLADGDFHGMIGRSAPMRHLFAAIRQIAPLNGPVVITGESGVGKELVARALHAESRRADEPFVPVNCAAMPAELMESELFGHAKGAFTGAVQQRAGLFVEADGGTLLLDEIGEMPLDTQAKLLRVLENGSIRPLGADREIRVDVRLVAATNRNLEAEVAAGRFRKDLFFRLETFPLVVPPLRDRGDDVDLLAARFVARFAALAGRPAPTLTEASLALLNAYPFPGNVRELANALERATAFCDGRELRPAHLPERIRRRRPSSALADEPRRDPVNGLADGPAHDPASGALSASDALHDGAFPLLEGNEPVPLAALERRYIRWVLDRVGGNKRRAAELLGIGRRTLYRRLDEGV